MDCFNPNQYLAVLIGMAALAFTVLSYLGLRFTGSLSPNEKKARELKDAYNCMKQGRENGASGSSIDANNSDPALEISELWIYPIKSIRGVRVPSALITAEGFYLDRRYMLLKIGDESPPKPKSMHISSHPSMALFQVTIPADSTSTFTISFRPPKSIFKEVIDLPFEPDKSQLGILERVNVEMYGSACLAYNMGSKYNDWFSLRFGFNVILAFWGGNSRPVLGNIPGRPATEIPKPRSALRKRLNNLPVIGSLLGSEVGIAFNDMASFLVINEASVRNVSERIEQSMDASKFRPNIIVKGSDTAFEEDYWAELTINPSVSKNRCKIFLTANCVRCPSLNVDYETGAPAQGKPGEVLKLLQKDRRVDKGLKYSPVFGRYGFPGKGEAGKVLGVGDRIILSKKNEERTRFVWRGITDST